MNIKTERETSFTPRSITFTFETQEELDAMFALFNFSAVAEYHQSLWEVWRELRKLFNADDMMRARSLDARDEILRHSCNRQEIIEIAREYTKP